MADNAILAAVRLPAIPFDPHADLTAAMVENLIQRLRGTQEALARRIAEVAELRTQVAGLQSLCDRLAEDLEACYECQDQGARALAAEEVHDGQDR